MKSFKEYINESGGYVALSVTPESTKKIKKVLTKYNITDIINKLHLTMMYDNSNPDIDISDDTVYTSKIVAIDMLGELDSPWRAIVFKLTDENLNDRFEELQSAGFTHSFDEFKPHVSIIYKPDKDVIKIINDNKADIISSIDTIQLHKEYNEPINKPDPKTA